MKLRTRTRGDRGSVLPLVALGLVMMLTMAAFAIDLGNARQGKGQAESTVDAAALAGAGAFAHFQNNGVNDDGTAASAISRAADYAFRNLGISPAPAQTTCGTGKYCYNASDTAHTSVEITSPYDTTKLKPDGTTYNRNELVHVRVCWDVKTQIAGVIGISSVRVCADSTARGVGPTGVNTPPQDALNDPYGRCPGTTTDVEDQIFDDAHWFPGDRNVHDGTTFGGTYLYGSDLDKASVIFTVDGVDYTFPGVVTPARSTDSSKVQIAAKAPPAGMFKYEIKYNKLPDKATLGNGLHTVALYARSVDGHCYQSLWTFTINNAPLSNGSPCQEDLFRGGQSPAQGADFNVADNSVIEATYFDETPLFNYTGTDPGTLSRNLIFNIDPATNPAGSNGIPAAQPNPQYNVPLSQASGLSAVPPEGTGYYFYYPGPGGGEYKYATRIWYNPPATLSNGQHTIYLRAYDSDQNKTGGDCGVAQWTVNFVNGTDFHAGYVELID